MTIGELAKSKGIWTAKTRVDNDSNIVLKSSIKLLRNIKGYCFAHKLAHREREAVEKKVIKSIEKNNYCSEVSLYPLRDCKGSDRKILVERNMLSGSENEFSTLVLSHDQDYYFILNARDHIEFVTVGSGLCFDDIYEYGKTVILELEKSLGFACSGKYGYLTACPKHSGLGMEVFVTLHLAGLVFLSRINRLIVELKNYGLGVRSSWIEGYYEIYNKYSIGLVEKVMYKNTLNYFQKIIENEREARERVYNANKSLIEDKVWRSYGALLSARLISHFEAFDLLSNVRLGIGLGIIDYLTVGDVNLLLYLIQDCHIRKNNSMSDENQNVDEVRARFLRDYLKEVM